MIHTGHPCIVDTNHTDHRGSVDLVEDIAGLEHPAEGADEVEAVFARPVAHLVVPQLVDQGLLPVVNSEVVALCAAAAAGPVVAAEDDSCQVRHWRPGVGRPVSAVGVRPGLEAALPGPEEVPPSPVRDQALLFLVCLFELALLAYPTQSAEVGSDLAVVAVASHLEDVVDHSVVEAFLVVAEIARLALPILLLAAAVVFVVEAGCLEDPSQ